MVTAVLLVTARWHCVAVLSPERLLKPVFENYLR